MCLQAVQKTSNILEYADICWIRGLPLQIFTKYKVAVLIFNYALFFCMHSCCMYLSDCFKQNMVVSVYICPTKVL